VVLYRRKPLAATIDGFGIILATFPALTAFLISTSDMESGMDLVAEMSYEYSNLQIVIDQRYLEKSKTLRIRLDSYLSL
jgi:hypothetical protein